MLIGLAAGFIMGGFFSSGSEAREPAPILAVDIQRAINSYERCVNNAEQYLSTAKNDAKDCTANIAKYEKKEKLSKELLVKYDKKRKEELFSYIENVDKAKKDYKTNNTKVEDALAKTGLGEKHLLTFLSLANKIGPIALQTLIEGEKLNVHFNKLYTYIYRECNEQLSIENYFNRNEMNLGRLVPFFHENGMINMPDLECEEGEQEYKDEILKLLQTTIEEAIEQKSQSPIAKKLNRVEKNKLKEICYKNPKKWKLAQQIKSDKTKKDLLKSSPPLITFFDLINNAMIVASRLLAIGYRYNTEQQLAISGKHQLQIKYASDSKNDEEIVNDNDPVIAHNQQMKVVAIHAVHVISTMKEVFDRSGSQLAVTFAKVIEDSCTEIVISKSNLRLNVTLALEVGKYKPAKLDSAAQLYWKMIDDGCIEIYKSAVEMSVVSEKYFSFFLRFRQSFRRYAEFMEDNAECPFSVSLEYLHKDLRDFLEFKNTYNAQLIKLNATANKCINDNVRNVIGLTEISNSLEIRNQLEDAYLTAVKNMHKKQSELDKEYMQLKQQESVIAAELARNKYHLETVQEIIRSGTNKNNNWQQKLDSLRDQLKDAK